MRPVAFDYIRPDTVEDASRALADDDDAAVLGGGQSLIPVLRFRLAAPSALVDLGGIGALREIREDGQDLVIGAMATHHDVARDPLVHAHAAVLAQAAASVADPQIRYRGTVGGALAHADPAGDIAPAALALDATLEITGTDGTRQVPAREFFEDFFTTALEPGELLSAIRVRKHTGWGMHYEKFSPAAQSWAIVAVAAAVRTENGSIAETRLGLANMGATPLRAPAAEQALAGTAAHSTEAGEAAARAGEDTDPPSDLGGTPEYRRHLAGVLAGRAVLSACGAAWAVEG
ncbi:MAG TPA: FAD binding domain-containing protein [Beutenbergiaceae bacterium]|nr:FAD binding domain-containing protein [Beutenbergiaceae bacterium]